MSEILVVGSLAYDTISTPAGKADRTLGGSANYFSLAASMYSKVRVVGVVGEDYDNQDFELLTQRGVDTRGLQRQKGKTFHWTGQYKADMNEAITLATDLNVFEHFNPEIPQEYKKSSYVFLANIDPVLQLRVLEQIESPKLVASDTMNFWISSKLPELKKVLGRVDVLLINEGEADAITGQANAIASAKEILKLGPKAVVVKRGEYGFVLLTSEGYFILPAYPVADVVDPTGAGDTFAGAFFGSLAKADNGFDLKTIKEACVQGVLLSSFTVEAFGVTKLKSLTWADIEQRHKQYHKVTTL